jgi:hypothetical protein
MKDIILNRAQFDYKGHIVSISDEMIARLKFPTTPETEQLSIYEMQVLSTMSLEKAIHFLLGLNSINYKYWSNEEKFVRYEHNGQVGALAAFEGFTQLFFNLDDAYLINYDIMKQYFGDIPEMGSRIDILRESFHSKHMHLATQLILNAIDNGSMTVKTASEVAKIMPQSFEDPYLKKIQLALYEMAILANTNHNKQVVYDLTVAADYQLPKVLEALGVLNYSQELSEKIEHGIPLISNGHEELAIRAATILSCEKIIHMHPISVSYLDRWLWLQRNDFNKKFHLTKTTYY